MDWYETHPPGTTVNRHSEAYVVVDPETAQFMFRTGVDVYYMRVFESGEADTVAQLLRGGMWFHPSSYCGEPYWLSLHLISQAHYGRYVTRYLMLQ